MKLKYLFIGLSMLPSSIIYAQSEAKLDQASSGIDLYLGIGVAGVRVDANNSDIESDKEGNIINGEILLNYYKPKYSFDLGLGWMTSSVDGEFTDKEKAENSVERDQVKQRIGFIDVALNYRWNETLEIGLISRTLIGKDASYSTFESDEKSSVTYLGFQVLKTFHAGSNYFRIGPQFMTDLNEKNRQVSWVGITAQLGIPMSSKKLTPAVKEVVKIVEKEKIVEVTRPVFILDSYHVNFETAKGEPNLEVKNFIKEMGALLSANPKKWEKLIIEGHSDPRGPSELNQRLSLDRAIKVKKLLIEAGIPVDRIKTLGKGSDNPLVDNNSDIALARNRRAEIHFSGLNDQNLIIKLNELKRKIEIPDTCKFGGCK